jgi:hypothetical protein
MSTVTLTLGQLVDRTMFELAGPGELGRRVVLADDGLATTVDTQLTLTDAGGVNISDLIELGSELVLVTAKTSDAVPVFTVARAYYQTTPATYSAGTIGYVNPPHPRKRVAEGLRRSLSRLEALGVPLIKTFTDSRTPGYQFIEVPADVRTVEDVLYWGSDGRLWPLKAWEFFDNLPTAKFPTGKHLNLGSIVQDADEIEVVYRAPYRWSNHPADPVEADTIELPEGAEELPVLYASAWVLSAREVSRSELDRSEEWGRVEQEYRGQSGAMLRAKWQEFYRALDDVRKLVRTPNRVVYRPQPLF